MVFFQNFNTNLIHLEKYGIILPIFFNFIFEIHDNFQNNTIMDFRKLSFIEAFNFKQIGYKNMNIKKPNLSSLLCPGICEGVF